MLKVPLSEGWIQRSEDLYYELLSRMGACLGYDFDKVHLKNQKYLPQAHGQPEIDQRAVRDGLLAVLKGERAIPIKLFDKPGPT